MEFYSYLYLREDETPYYAGKGTGKRAFKRRGFDVRPPKDKSRVIIFPMLNETEALESEIALIEFFGRKDLGTGCLYNRTNGGDGASGLKWTPEAIKKMSESRTGEKCYWLFGKRGKGTPRFGIKVSHTEETKQKMSKTRRETKQLVEANQAHGRKMIESGVLNDVVASKGRHNRWHTNRGIIKQGCLFCEIKEGYPYVK